MRKLIAALLLITSSQLTLWATDKVIVKLAPNANASVVAAAVGGKVIDSIPSTRHYLMQVPSAATLAGNPQLGVVTIELNDAVTLRPTVRLAILKTPASKAPEWYDQQPAFKLVRADAALHLSKGRGVVIADINARVDYAHPALIGHLTGGYDFLAARGSRSALLTHASPTFFHTSPPPLLYQLTPPFL